MASKKKCPKCNAISGDYWTQCNGICPMKMSPHYKKPVKNKIHPLAIALVLLKDKLFKVGLIATAQQLEHAITEIGWEIADLNKHARMKAGDEYFKKNKAAILKEVKTTDKYFVYAPKCDNPAGWNAPVWRWFLKTKRAEELKRRKANVRSKSL